MYTDCTNGIVMFGGSTLGTGLLRLERMATGISGTANEIEVVGALFKDMDVAISLEGMVNSLTIQSTFNNCSQPLDLSQITNLGYLSIRNSNFVYGGSLVLSLVEETVYDFKNMSFENSTSNTAVIITSTRKESTFNSLNLSNGERGITFTGTGSLAISGSITNYTCGLEVETTSVDFSVSLSNVGTGLIVTNSTDVDIHTSYFGEVMVPVDINPSVHSFIISYSLFERSGPVHFWNYNSTGGVYQSKFRDMNDGAISLVGGTSWRVSQNEFENISSASDGGCLVLENGDFDLWMSDFTNVSSYGNGGAIYSRNASIKIETCNFYNASGLSGGALYGEDMESVDIENNSYFSGCTALTYGGAIEIENSELRAELFDVSFVDNSAENGAAVSCCSNSTDCNVTVNIVYDSVTLTHNENREQNGSDISCAIYVTPTQTPIPIHSISSGHGTGFYVGIWILIFAILFGCCGGVFAAVFIVLKKKRDKDMGRYEEID